MKWSSRCLVALLSLSHLLGCALAQCSSTQTEHLKPRVLVLSDIANEPDDAESLVRFMVYSHQFRVQGLVATTSYWLNATTMPEQMVDIVQTYKKVLPNLKKHAEGWPDADLLIENIKSGLPVYGMDGVGPGKDSSGSELLVKAVDASSEPLWVLIWGGASVLAQALWKINATRSPEEAQRFYEKIRVYAISDQDNSGVWIRRHWPQIFYIASVHHFNHYPLPAWTGMSGERFRRTVEGSGSSFVSKEWIHEHVQAVGELGKKYPDFEFIPEGDSPSLLYLIQNGLSDPEYPEWGSWGGRYGPVNFGDGHFADTTDIVTCEDGVERATSQGTVWRWRKHYQSDFAARMQWTVAESFEKANHAPVAVVNGECGLASLRFHLEPGSSITLDASDSFDPDGDKLAFKWWQYREPSLGGNSNIRFVPPLTFERADRKQVTITLPSKTELLKYNRRSFNSCMSRDLHVVLEVSDGSLVAYRRILINFEVCKEPSGDQTFRTLHQEL